MRNPIWLLLGVAAACSPPAPPPPVVTVSATRDTLVLPVVEVRSAVPRSDGSWTALAVVEGELYLVDFDAHKASPYPGITKTDVPHPTTLIGVGDSIIVGDWGLRRFTEWSPGGQRLNAWPAPDALHGSLARARDAAGQWYFQISSDPGSDGSGLLDSAAVVRSDPQLAHFDTLARLAPPEVVKVPGVVGMHYQRRVMGGDDAWGVMPDGTLWLARVFQNYIEWRRPGAKKVEKSPLLPDRVLTNTEMDHEIWVRRYPEDQRDAARALPNAPVKPPFEKVFAMPDGKLWLFKSDTALAPVRQFQIVDPNGVEYYVAVPSRGFALGVTPQWILMGEEFPGGIRLMRYPVPAPPSTGH